MRNHNSQNMSFYAQTLGRIYHDMVSAILPHNEIERDLATLLKRSSNEGTDFFTKVLPALGKSIDVSLANGTVLNVSGFRKKAGTNLPRFAHELFRAVFRDDGVPWFATWYSDFCITYNKLAEMEAAGAAFDHKELLEKHPYSHTLVWGLKFVYSDDNRSRRLSDEFPGLHVLNKSLLCRKTREAISLGVYQAGQPLLSDEELNSRREAMVVALRTLRQVCYCFYKLNLPYTDGQKTRTLEDFVAVDESLNFEVRCLSGIDGLIHKRARKIICRVLANADPRTGIPRHGPGAVATGEKLPDKHHFSRFYRRLDGAFRYDEWFFCNQSHVCDSFEEFQAFQELEAGTAKVVLVPKDSRGPRLISCEPLEYQWIQQSLMSVLVDTIESHPLTRGMVNFTNQTINRDLALKGSLSYDKVTLDMKDASDRVSCELVKSLFPDSWWECLYASRSDTTQLPCGRIVPLKKFAPMGSAVCFPVEALIFWAISVSTLIIRHNLSLREATTKVHVYGDDIICDAAYHGEIRNTLPKFGLMLNDNKCCVAGPFKESCGMDAFFGHSVTPTKIRSTWSQDPEPGVIASYVEYSNAFYRSGQFETAYFLEEEIQAVLRRARMSAVPTVSGGNPSCIAFVRPNERPIPKNRALGLKFRFSNCDVTRPSFQKLEVRGYRLETKSIMTKSYGWPFLLRKLAEMEAKNQHHSISGVPTGANSLVTGQYPSAFRVKLKKAWTCME